MMDFWKSYIKNLYWIWKWFRKVAAVLLLIFMAALLVSWLGHTEEIETTLNACVVTQAGEVRTCQVYIKGEMNLYPMRHGQDYFYTEPMGTGIRGISINGKPGMGELYSNNSHKDLLLGASDRGVYFMNREATLVFAETDLKYIFPELDSQRCILAAPASDVSQVRQLISQQTIPAYHAEKFSWLLEN